MYHLYDICCMTYSKCHTSCSWYRYHCPVAAVHAVADHARAKKRVRACASNAQNVGTSVMARRPGARSVARADVIHWSAVCMTLAVSHTVRSYHVCMAQAPWPCARSAGRMGSCWAGKWVRVSAHASHFWERARSMRSAKCHTAVIRKCRHGGV